MVDGCNNTNRRWFCHQNLGIKYRSLRLDDKNGLGAVRFLLLFAIANKWRCQNGGGPFTHDDAKEDDMISTSNPNLSDSRPSGSTYVIKIMKLFSICMYWRFPWRLLSLGRSLFRVWQEINYDGGKDAKESFLYSKERRMEESKAWKNCDPILSSGIQPISPTSPLCVCPQCILSVHESPLPILSPKSSRQNWTDKHIQPLSCCSLHPSLLSLLSPVKVRHPKHLDFPFWIFHRFRKLKGF